MNEERPTLGSVKLARKEFDRLAEFIETELGIKMPNAKITMVEARLQKRLRMLGLHTFKDYCDYVFSPEGEREELIHMIDVVTTNKTDFFREPSHFDYLVQHALPSLQNETGAGISRPLSVWSAGCSTGEEPYTLAMVLSDYQAKVSDFKFFIIATDISTRVLHAAQAGIYDEDKVSPVPPSMRKRYLLRSRDRERKAVRIVPELRSLVHFRRLNFMDGDFGFREKIDVIFCRNVIIYFDRNTQQTLLTKFSDCQRRGGYFFMGHSETQSGLDLPYKAAVSTVYRRI